MKLAPSLLWVIRYVIYQNLILKLFYTKGFWDPLGLLKDADEERFKRLRTVETKHGRIAMLAILGHLVTTAGLRNPYGMLPLVNYPSPNLTQSITIKISPRESLFPPSSLD